MKRYFLFILLSTFCLSFSNSKSGIGIFIDDYIQIKYNINISEYLFVSIKRQKLYYINKGATIKEYDISSALNGIGQEKNSQKTPIGLHIIKQKFGSGLPKAAILKERIFTGEVATIFTDGTNLSADDVTSRILWLSGLEDGINKGGAVDSYNRFIYIHGTAEEGLIGTPSSHGCIRMRNDDVIELFELIPTKTHVLILNH